MSDQWNDLLACLDLRTRTPAAGPPVFEGRNQRLDYHRLFGGQLLAQFVRAACLACPGRTVKSLHVLFPRAGRADEPVRYEARCLRQGSTFAAWSLTAHQSAGAIATASVSLHSAESGPDLQTTAPPPAVLGPEHRVELDLLPWDTRTTVDLDDSSAGQPAYDLWMRTPKVDAELSAALLAYATDLTLIGTALRPLAGMSQRDAGRAFTSAVTSHTVWFHRPFRVDEWLLLHQHSPILAHGRCHGRGDVLTEDGSLVASYAQDALLRFPPDGS